MMLRTAARRRLGAGWVALALVAQLLIASHACAAPVVIPDLSEVPQAHCHEVSSEEPALADDTGLCKVHCEASHQVPTQAGTHAPPPPSTGWFIVMDEPAPAVLDVPALPRWPLVRSGAPPGWPPLHLTLQVLRN